MKLARIGGTLLVLALTTVAHADGGGGPVEEPQDRATQQIDQIQARVMARAESLGLAPLRKAATAAGLQFPVLSTPAETGLQSFGISNYVDLDPASGAVKDFACGSRTYDGHGGRDIFLLPTGWDMVANQSAVVVAAGDGTIVETHDREDDRRCDWNANYPANYVVIQHDNGLMGYYWHMKRGSVTTKPAGSRVTAGEIIGSIGSSGISTGPHLHFEVRGSDGVPLEPSAGSCNTGVSSTQWAQQPGAVDTMIDNVASHYGAPRLPSSSCDSSPIAYSDSYLPGDAVYGSAFVRDQKAGDSILLQILRPDGSVAASFATGSPSSGFWTFSWWYTWYQLPTNAPLGEWRVRATLGAQVAEHVFVVRDPATPGDGLGWTSVALQLTKPVIKVAATAAFTVPVTITNSGTTDAIGCRLSFSGPILADVAYQRLAGGGMTAQPANFAFDILAGKTAKASLTVTPRTGFKAKNAVLPVRATCTNSDGSAYVPGTTTLTVTTK